MSRPPHAREKVLDAFERLLIEDGERAGTMDATARAAGVSKGGLLYHFPSKDALEQGLIARLDELVEADIAEMAASPEGPVAFFVRTSAMDGDRLDRAIVSVSRLAQGGSTAARDALHAMRERWADALRAHVADDAALDLVLLVSDGLYYNNSLQGQGVAGPVPTGPAMDALLALVDRATRP
ncbi:TetR/AcrR family transcriptional regulator [Microbacterium sp. SORGH_AS_0888]|uniref:TetR/AcrR family transcriptional regulator n=1 Tax=Microbacterium sp. SORGH_AS_0888 TaxID=3041791 RepID=UPI002783305A|nr:TetR/AcrR family transcriptional regulator [Microbacterium sp. SORGH_AS_0888]MDQ1128318.1 AcrR family transcriptional regulator [Microbacterium sp. SORGH_AS_0888]